MEAKYEDEEGDLCILVKVSREAPRNLSTFNLYPAQASFTDFLALTYAHEDRATDLRAHSLSDGRGCRLNGARC